jgi:flagellar assembly factor FliW
MPRTETKYFGIIDFDAGSAIEFPAGLPGFEKHRHFLILEDLARRPVTFLQSLDEPRLCFLMMPAVAIDPSYRLRVSPDDLHVLELDQARQPEIGTEVMCLAIVAISGEGNPTANLLAPLVVNPVNGRAVQAIRDDGMYGCCHPLMTETPEAPCS